MIKMKNKNILYEKVVTWEREWNINGVLLCIVYLFIVISIPINGYIFDKVYNIVEVNSFVMFSFLVILLTATFHFLFSLFNSMGYGRKVYWRKVK